MENYIEIKLPTAYEAHRMTHDVLGEELRDELEIINSKIRDKIDDGDFYCEIFDQKISLHAKQILEEMFYSVEYVEDGMNEYKTVIKWEYVEDGMNEYKIRW